MDAWRDRVFDYLQNHGGSSTTSLLGTKVPRQSSISYVASLEPDSRFYMERKNGDIFVRLAPVFPLIQGVGNVIVHVPRPIVAAPVAVAKTTGKRKQTKKQGEPKPKKTRVLPPPKFVPAKTDFSPPSECWDVVLGSYKTWTPALTSWKWIFTLSSVSKTFADALRPIRTYIIKTMAILDDKGICKSQSNALFALSPKELSKLPYTVVEINAGYFSRVMHLLSRQSVLDLAFRRSGESFEEINLAFLKRKERLAKLRAERKPTKRKHAVDRWVYFSSDEDQHY